jgi:hypothetical protein
VPLDFQPESSAIDFQPESSGIDFQPEEAKQPQHSWAPTLGLNPGRETDGGLYQERVPLELQTGRQPSKLPGLGELVEPLIPLRPFSLGSQLEIMAEPRHVPGGLPALKTAAGAVKGVENVVTGGGQFMTSPLGFATLGLGAAPAAVRALASAGFAADMVSHAPDSWQKYWEAAYAGDRPGQAEALTEGLGNLGMAGLAGSHGYREARTALEPMARKLARELEATPLPAAGVDFVPEAQVREVTPAPGVFRGELKRQLPELTLPGEPHMVKPSPPTETITGLGPAGPDEGTASAMPAEREERPTAATVSQPERPFDIIDAIEGHVGKINPKLIRETDTNWRAIGAARGLFSAASSIHADQAMNALQNEGLLQPDVTLDQFKELLNGAAVARKNFRGTQARYEKSIVREGKQEEQFQRRVLAGERPRAQAAAVEQVPVEHLIEGDKFMVQDHEFTVRKLEFDEDANLTGVVVKDGPKFGVQTIKPGQEFIHIDKGTLKPVPREEWTTDSTTTEESFSLGAPESVEEQRVRMASEAQAHEAQAAQRAIEERGAAAKRKMLERAAAPLGGDLGSAGQGGLFVEPGQQEIFQTRPPRGTGGIGDPIGMPVPPPGTPVGLHAHGRMPVAMEPIVPGAVDNPTVMAALENVMRAIGSQVPIRTGRFYAHARGIYKSWVEVIRLQQSDNIPTAAHEVSHAFSDVIFGSPMSKPLIAAVGNKAVVKELQALGKALYGSRQPVAGYTAEGLSELTRLWLTTEDVAKLAPRAAAWFENTLLPAHPEMAEALRAARDKIDIWRGQGAEGRARQQMKEPPGALARLQETLRTHLGRHAQVEELEPLRELSEGFRQTSGRRLSPAADPFLLATAKRGSAGAVMDTMVERGMVDIWGNVTGPGLKEALARVKPAEAEAFAHYLWARRAIERWRLDRNPGMALEDAKYLRTKLETPAFVDAASKWYKWWDGILEYVKQASPATNAATIEAIRKGSHDYVPLARALDPAKVKGESTGATGGGLYRMRGSGLPIRNIYQQALLVAEKMVSKAHKDLVLDAIFKLSHSEGMGWLVEKVPRARAMETVNIEKIREQLEAAGVDTSPIPPDELLKFASFQDKPSGTDPIMVRNTADGPQWFQVPARVFDLMQGLDPARLGPVADLFLAAPNRLFKLGTTGLRASFSLVTNPARDLQTFLLQSAYGNPASRVGAYFSSLFDIVRAGVGGKESPEWSAFKRLGIQGGMFLGGDIQHARREARTLFRGRVMRRIASPVESLREALSFTEAVPRLAEMRLAGREMGWTPGAPLTPEQAIAMSVAAKRVTTDFSAAGAVGKTWNQAMPFYNATIQGTRAFLRAFRRDNGVKDEPHRAMFTVLKGLSLLTLPVLANWWANKDKDWYRQLPWRERYLYTNIEGPGGELVQVPRPAEWANMFMVLPEMLMDSWHQKDPESARRGLEHIFTTQNPLTLPSTFETARQQWQNEISFFGRPIVPRSEIDLPPGEQRAYFSSKLALALGNAFPNQVSPRRVDAAVRSLAGGLGGDLMDAPGRFMQALGLEESPRGFEPADWPIGGRLFRRGGQFSANNQSLADFWDDYTRSKARMQAYQLHAKQGTETIGRLDAGDIAYAQVLEGYHGAIKLELEVAARTKDPAARQRLYQEAAKLARLAIAARPSK